MPEPGETANRSKFFLPTDNKKHSVLSLYFTNGIYFSSKNCFDYFGPWYLLYLLHNWANCSLYQPRVSLHISVWFCTVSVKIFQQMTIMNMGSSLRILVFWLLKKGLIIFLFFNVQIICGCWILLNMFTFSDHPKQFMYQDHTLSNSDLVATPGWGLGVHHLKILHNCGRCL